MATYKPGTAGEFNGKIGNLVISKWKKIRIGRATPRKTHKKITLKALTQRTKFKANSVLLRSFLDVIQVGFPADKSNVYGWSKAVKCNAQYVVESKNNEYTVALNKMKLSMGMLDQVIAPEMSYADNELYIDWLNPDHLNLGAEEDDRIQLCIYRPHLERKKVEFKKNIAWRKATFFKYQLKGLNYREPVYIWIFLVSANGKKVSDSQYVGRIYGV